MGEEGMIAVAEKAEEVSSFSIEAATACMLGQLLGGPKDGEALVWGCRKAGNIPHDDRAFGVVVKQLHKNGLIKRVGYCSRQRPGTGGPQSVWALT